MSVDFSENHPRIQLSQPYIFEETGGKGKAASRVAGVSLSLSSSHLVARASPAGSWAVGVICRAPGGNLLAF